jgi:hypothetical protein
LPVKITSDGKKAYIKPMFIIQQIEEYYLSIVGLQEQFDDIIRAKYIPKKKND